MHEGDLTLFCGTGRARSLLAYLNVVLRLSNVCMKLAMCSEPKRVSFESRYAELKRLRLAMQVPWLFGSTTINRPGVFTRV